MKAYAYDATILEVTGKDSERYLNARLSNDIKKLTPGGSLLAAALTAQGRVEALFSVHRVAQDNFLLAATSNDREKIAQIVKRFIVADRVSVSDLSERWTLWHLLDSNKESVPADAILLDPFSDKSWGLQLLHKKGAAITAINSISSEEFNLARFKLAIPLFPSEINDEYILAEGGLREAASFTKGCYVGQEVLERIDSHGKAPRVLRLLRARVVTNIKTGDEICSDKATIGRVRTLCVDDREQSTYIFAYLKNDPLVTKFICQGIDLEVLK